MTIQLTKATYIAGVAQPSGSEHTLDPSLEAALVHQGSATWVGDDPTTFPGSGSGTGVTLDSLSSLPTDVQASDLLLVSRGGVSYKALGSQLNVAPDTTAPTLSAPTGAETSDTTATIGATTDDPTGTGYWAVSTSATRSAAQIKAGTGCVAFGTISVSGTSLTKDVTGLTAATLYYGHWVQDDPSSNESNVVNSSSFTTDAAADTTAPTLSGFTDTETSDTTATLAATTDETNGTAFWALTSTSTPPSSAQIIAGSGGGIVAAGSQAVSTTSISINVTGLTAETTYYGHLVHRDASLNVSSVATGNGFTTEAAGGGLMLDGVSDVVAAYSTRQLRTAYAGSAIRVQRSSDSTEQDIGFSAGVLDTAALAAFVGASNGTLVKWYDQSGNANDLTAVPAGPTVRASSANIVINTTRPAMRITGNLPTGTYSVNPTNTRRVFAVAKKDSLSGGGALLGASATGGFLFRVEATTGNLQLLKQAALNLATSTSGIAAATASVMEASYNPSSGAYTFYVDGTAAGSGTNAQTMTAATPYLGGTNGAGDTFAGEIGELVITDASGDIPSGTRTAIEDNMQAYWGTP